jgi:hypothetical protein
MKQMQGQILVVSSAAEVGLVRELFREYQLSLDVDLGFQDFERELYQLPGEYQAPYGALLLALVNGQPAGCCALRPLLSSDYTNACEMKRLSGWDASWSSRPCCWHSRPALTACCSTP